VVVVATGVGDTDYGSYLSVRIVYYRYPLRMSSYLSSTLASFLETTVWIVGTIYRGSKVAGRDTRVLWHIHKASSTASIDPGVPAAEDMLD
jgi:hypothetical protein